MHTKKASFSTYFGKIQSIDITEFLKVFNNRLSGKDADIEDYKRFCSNSDDFLRSINSYILITDLKTMRFLYVTPSVQLVTGYTPAEILEGGIPIFLKNYCPADRVNGRKILQKITEHQKIFELSDKNSYQYITTFRFLNNIGHYSWMYNRMIYLEHGENRLPNLQLSIVTNIDLAVQDDKLHYSRLRYNKISGVYEFEFSEEFAPEYLDILSSKEIDILKLLSEGLSNTQIAANLNHTEHTIKHYRKQMLKKTWCDNTAELLCFALRNKLIGR